MGNTKRQFADGKYGQIHFRIGSPEQPSKRPLVCLHMFPQSGRNFEKFVEVACDDRIVIAPDFPGYGESSSPPQPISAQDYARAIWDLIDDLSLCEAQGNVDLFGIHAGAKLAVEVARQRPKDVNRIVLSSAAVLYEDEVEAIRNSMAPVQLDEAGTRFQHLWKLLVKNRSPEVTLEMCATGLAEMIRGGEKSEWGHTAVFEYNKQFASVLREITHPVALLNPGDDLYQYTPRSMQYLPNAVLLDLPEWNHGFLDLHADKVAQIVHDWVDEGSLDVDSSRAEPVAE